MIEYEMRGLELFFRGGGMSDTLSDISMRIITPRIDDVLKERVKVRAGLSREYHAAGYFKTYELKQTIRNHPEVNTLDDPTSQRSTPITGLEKCLGYMLRMGLLERATLSGVRAEVYRITDTLKAAVEDI
jgi:hypothetical protein